MWGVWIVGLTPTGFSQMTPIHLRKNIIQSNLVERIFLFPTVVQSCKIQVGSCCNPVFCKPYHKPPFSPMCFEARFDNISHFVLFIATVSWPANSLSALWYTYVSLIFWASLQGTLIITLLPQLHFAKVSYWLFQMFRAKQNRTKTKQTSASLWCFWFFFL